MAMGSNTSSKYEDIISRSTKISSECPSQFRLTTQTEYVGTLRKITLGVKDHNKINKTILLVGETGAGKSTLINALVNYAMDVQWEDKIWFELVNNEKTAQTRSQTNDVTVYEICDFKENVLPYSLTIIDTPGYGHSDGIQCDFTIRHRLYDLFRSEKGVHEINVVGLVLKSTENRLHERLGYVLDSVVSLFGKDMEEHIVAFMTHSNGKVPKNALGALKAANTGQSKNEEYPFLYFLFDNCQDEERTNEEEEDKSFEVTLKGIRDFTEFLERTAPEKLHKTLHVLNEQIRLQACIKDLQDQIKLIKQKQAEIQQTEEALKNYKKEMKSNENYTIKVEEVYKEKEAIDGGMLLMFFAGAVCCTTCKENCHYPGCTMAWYPSHCDVIKNRRCTVCTGKCPVTDHVKEKWRYVDKIREVTQTKEEMKDKFERNKEESEKTANVLESLEKKMGELKAEKIKFLEESYQHIAQLEETALNVISLSTHDHLNFLIENMNEVEDKEKVQKLKEMASRANEVTKAGLRYLKTAKKC